MRDRYLEVQTPLDLGQEPIDWLGSHGFQIGSLEDIRNLFPETRSSAMRNWMDGHPELPDSASMPFRLWATIPNHVIRCHHYFNDVQQRQIWWFSPNQADLAMLFKLAFAG